MSKKPTKKILKVNLKIIFDKLVVDITQKRTKMFQKFQRILVQQDNSKRTDKLKKNSLKNKKIV